MDIGELTVEQTSVSGSEMKFSTSGGRVIHNVLHIKNMVSGYVVVLHIYPEAIHSKDKN
jgi:hypothetical protein